MAKNTVADWSTTAADNTDIGGIVLSDSTQIDALDNIVREMMAQLKTSVALKDDSPQTFTGNVIATGYFRSFGGGSASTPSVQPGEDADTGIYWVGANRIGFATGGTKALEINASQQVLAGTGSAAAPTYSFDGDVDTGLFSAAANAVGIAAAGAEVCRVTSSAFFVGDASFTGASVRSRVVSSTGRVDINNASGGSATILGSYYAGGVVGSITNNSSSTAFNTSSDERLKENFEDFDSGTIIDGIKVYHYDWRSGGSGFGPKAQELYNVFPDAVAVGSIGDSPEDKTFVPWGYDAAKIVPVLIREIQRLRQRVQALET